MDSTSVMTITTKSGYVVAHGELCRIMMQTLRELGLMGSWQALEKESGIHLFGNTTSRLSAGIEAGDWQQLLEEILPGLPWPEQNRLELAKEVVIRVQIFDLCVSGEHQKVLDYIRRSPESLHGPLSSLLLFRKREEIQRHFLKLFGADALSRSWMKSYIQNLLDANEFVEESRLLSIIDDAYLFQKQSFLDLSEPLWAFHDDSHERSETERTPESEQRATILTPSGLLISFVELVRILYQAIADLGYASTARSILQESGVEMDSAVSKSFRENVLNGRWIEVYASLHQQHWQSILELKKAEEAILRQHFLELCEAGEFTQAIECLRHDSAKSLASFSRFIMFTDPTRLREAAGFSGAAGNSRVELWVYLQSLFTRRSGLRPARLLDLLDDAIKYSVRHCLFHNESKSSVFSLLKKHSCSSECVPQECCQSLCGHIDEIWFIAFSKDGKRLASASKDSTLRVWETNLDNGATYWQQLHCIRSGARHVSFLCWSDDSTFLVACGSKKRVSVWDVRTAYRVCSLKGHKDQVLACAWVSQPKPYIITGSVDHQIILWSLTGERLFNWRTQSAIHDLCVTHDGRYLFASAAQFTVQIYDLGKRETLSEFSEESQQITSFAISSDSSMLLVTVVKPAEIHLWSVDSIANPQMIRKFLGTVQDKFIVRCAFGGIEDAFVVSGSEDCSVLIWNRHTGDRLFRLRGHQGSVNAVCWHPTNPFILASASDDHTIRIWSTKRSQNRLELQESNGCMRSEARNGH